MTYDATPSCSPTSRSSRGTCCVARAIGDVSGTGTLNETGALLVQAADELVIDHRLGDATWSVLQQQ